MKKLNQHLSYTAYLLIRLIAVLNGTAEDEFHLWNLYLLFGTARFLIELCRFHLEPPRTLFFTHVKLEGHSLERIQLNTDIIYAHCDTRPDV